MKIFIALILLGFWIALFIYFVNLHDLASILGLSAGTMIGIGVRFLENDNI